MHNIAMLDELRAGDVSLAGGKAANLGELISAGFPVPAGLCVTISAYRAALAQLQLQPQLDSLSLQLDEDLPDELLEQSSQAIRTAIEQAAISAPVIVEIEQAYRQLCQDDQAVAVRSSATTEDSPRASFAGQYYTELDVRTFDALLTAVKRCWASLWRAQAIRYRHRHRFSQTESGMAVVVQRMVRPDVSGVMFTIDPIANANERIVIEASWGCGEAVVSGLVKPDRFDISKADLKLERVELATKQKMISSTPEGTVISEVPKVRQTAASLTTEQASTLAKMGRAIEAHFRCPQDIEWAIASDRVAILQARPVTAATAQATRQVSWESPIPGAKWARMSICDSWLPLPLSPLFATTLFPALIKGWLKGWAGLDSDESTNPLLPKPMSGTINGYAYLRIDYPLNRYPLRTVKLIATWLWHYLGGVERRWRAEIHPRHVGRLTALRRIDLASCSVADICRIIAEAQELSGEYWGIVGGLAWYWNAGEWVLAKAYPRLWPAGGSEGAAPGYGSLLQGLMTRTTEAEIELHRLARLTGGRSNVLTSPSLAEGGENRGCGEFAEQFQTYLDTYGHQVYDLDFVEPTPAEDPAALLSTLQTYRDGRAGDPSERLRLLAERREALIAEMFKVLRRSPIRRWLFKAILRWTSHYGRLRDHALFDFTLGWPLIRRAYLELGRRLVASGAFERPEDVFFLTREELDAELEAIGLGRAPGRWSDVVRERRGVREEQKHLSPPEQIPERVRLFLAGVDITSLAFLRRLVKAKGDSKIRGSAVSPGRVTAPARTVCSVQDFKKLQSGDILIAPYITPAWMPLLAIAGGVVTDAGGTLSHGSIVAREYGIPAVMGTQNATKLIQDGQIVTVDGDRGVVY
jgi:phosphohistidine swiveling domain-containing protein